MAGTGTASTGCECCSVSWGECWSSASASASTAGEWLSGSSEIEASVSSMGCYIHSSPRIYSANASALPILLVERRFERGRARELSWSWVRERANDRSRPYARCSCAYRSPPLITSVLTSSSSTLSLNETCQRGMLDQRRDQLCPT